MALRPMNVTCRGCRTEIDLNASTCPICLRPRDRSEMLEDAKRLREGQAAAKRRPFVVLGWVAGLGALGWAGWTYRAQLDAAVSSVRDKADAVMDHASDPKTYAPAAQSLPQAGEPGAPAAPPPAPGAPSDAPQAHAPSAPSLPAPEAGPAQEKPHDFSPLPLTYAPSEMFIILYGWVYDVATARPVPGAAVRFTDRMSGAVVATNADWRGWYEVQVPRENSGLVPEASVTGYRRETLSENEPAWHERKASARKRAASARPDEVLLTFTSRQEEAQVNVVLVPLPR